MRVSDYSPNPVLMTQEDIDKLVEIQNLLDEGLAHYLTYEGHAKSSEGHVSLNFDTSWARRAGAPQLTVSVYSYVLGPHRSHDFDSIDEALAEVRKWHANEMAYDPDTEENLAAAEEWDNIAHEFITQMQEEGRLHIVEVGQEDPNISTICKKCGGTEVDDLGCFDCWSKENQAKW